MANNPCPDNSLNISYFYGHFFVNKQKPAEL